MERVSVFTLWGGLTCFLASLIRPLYPPPRWENFVDTPILPIVDEAWRGARIHQLSFGVDNP